MSSQPFTYAQKRRSTRIDQAVPLVVQGVGSQREPYQEQVSTISISCHGCTYLSKHEVIQGETVYLDLLPGHHGSTGTSSRARVKWTQKTQAKDKTYQIAVELESAGNIWGVATPPEDWFPLRVQDPNAPAPASRELKLVPRKEPQAVKVSEQPQDSTVHPTKAETAALAVPPIAQLMVGLGEQMQAMASEAASSALVKEKGKIVDEFRLQLRNETVKVIQSAVVASKDVIVRQAMKELNEMHEAAARNNYAQWRKRLEQDVASAQQHLAQQAKELSQRIEALANTTIARVEASANTTIERVQQNLEVTRSEAVDRFMGRLREQLGPLVAEARESLQKLEASEAAFKKESANLYAGLENQLAYSADTNLAKVQEELDRTSASISAKTNQTLQDLYQQFERAAQDNVNALLASVADQIASNLQQKAGEVSRQYSAGLEDYTTNYLESIGRSITEISQKVRGNNPQ